MSRPPRLLDAGVAIALQKVGYLHELAALAKEFEIAIVEEVYDELTRPPNNKNAALAKDARAALVSVNKVSLDVGGAAAAVLPALLGPPRRISSKDAASIAWALHEGLDYTFVTRDAVAAYRALEELLGHRVLGFFGFLREAMEVGALSDASARAIAHASVTTDGVRERPPSWWGGWLHDRATPAR